MTEFSRQTPKNFDLVVLGAGLAGHCAALAATEAGAQVLLIEKQDKAGGSTVLSGGFFAFADTPLQQAAGVSDSPDLLFKDLQAMAGGEADDQLLTAYSKGQYDLYRWLVDLGARFVDLELGAGQSVPRSHRTDPAALIQRLGQQFEELGGTTMFGARAIRLIRPEMQAPVTGVVVETASGTQDAIRAHAVVLATGGFVWSDELLGNFAPNQRAALRVGGLGNTGDGLRMAWQLGAGFRDMGQIKGTFGAHPDTKPERHEIMLSFYLGAIMVNAQGRRFIDESVSYKLLGDACLQQPGATAWQIFDHAIFETSPKGVPLFDLAPALDRGLLIRADTLDELAQICGIEPDALSETAATYNLDIKSGRDSVFGRDGLCHHAGTLVPIAKPPFYAYPSNTVVLATYCGLTIDPDARVIDIAGQPIEGLYAAGEITGGFHGVAYMTGTSLGKSAFFGRVAGRSAAAHASAST